MPWKPASLPRPDRRHAEAASPLEFTYHLHAQSFAILYLVNLIFGQQFIKMGIANGKSKIGINVLLFVHVLTSVDKFPSSVLFDTINESANDKENKADFQKAIKDADGIFAFTLKNTAGDEDTWYVDLKETGKVTKDPKDKADSK